MGIAAKDFIPAANPDLRAGKRLDVGHSLKLLVPESSFKGVRLGVEMMFPTYQDLDGPQLETDWTLTAGVQYAF